MDKLPEEIENINTHTQTTLKQYKLPIISFIILYWLLLGLLIFAGFANSIELFWWGLPVFLLVGLYAYIRSQNQARFMKELAKRLNFTYTPEGSFKDKTSNVFSIGDGYSISHEVKGMVNNQEVEFFILSYGVGSGKSRQRYTHTVVEIEVNVTVPDLVLLSNNKLYRLAKNLDKITLKESLDNKLSLYCEKDFGIEALQIITPELLEKLKTNFGDFNLEFKGNKVYVFSYDFIPDKKDITRLYNLAVFIATTVSPKIAKLERQILNLRSAYNKSN